MSEIIEESKKIAGIMDIDLYKINIDIDKINYLLTKLKILLIINVFFNLG